MAEVQNYADSYARRDLHVYEIPILENLPTVYKVVQVNTYDRWKTEKMKWWTTRVLLSGTCGRFLTIDWRGMQPLHANWCLRRKLHYVWIYYENHTLLSQMYRMSHFPRCMYSFFTVLWWRLFNHVQILLTYLFVSPVQRWKMKKFLINSRIVEGKSTKTVRNHWLFIAGGKRIPATTVSTRDINVARRKIGHDCLYTKNLSSACWKIFASVLKSFSAEHFCLSACFFVLKLIKHSHLIDWQANKRLAITDKEWYFRALCINSPYRYPQAALFRITNCQFVDQFILWPHRQKRYSVSSIYLLLGRLKRQLPTPLSKLQSHSSDCQKTTCPVRHTYMHSQFIFIFGVMKKTVFAPFVKQSRHQYGLRTTAQSVIAQ